MEWSGMKKLLSKEDPIIFLQKSNNKILGVLNYKNGIYNFYSKDSNLKILKDRENLHIFSHRLSESNKIEENKLLEFLKNKLQIDDEIIISKDIENKIINLGDNSICVGKYNQNLFVIYSKNFLPFKIDFLFPNFSLIFNYQKNSIFKLERCYVPFTYLHIRDKKIKDVLWVIPYNKNDVIFVPYPFNTYRDVCSNLNTYLKSNKNINHLHWYGEIPSSDIPSIKPELTVCLLYALKNNLPHLIPFLYRNNIWNDNEELVKCRIDFSFNIKVNLKFKRKSDIERVIKGQFSVFYMPKNFMLFFQKKYGNKIHLEDDINVKCFRSK